MNKRNGHAGDTSGVSHNRRRRGRGNAFGGAPTAAHRGCRASLLLQCATKISIWRAVFVPDINQREQATQTPQDPRAKGRHRDQ